MKSDLDDYTVAFVHRTSQAVLVNDGDQNIWLPLSKIEIEETNRRDEKGRRIVIVTVPDWLAIEKGLA